MTTTADNPAILETLWHEHYAALQSYMRRRLPAGEVEDALQTVWLLALEALRKGIGYTESARGWLFRIAHNLIVDTYRWHDRRTIVDLDDTLPDSSSVTDRVLARLEAQRVRRSVNKLRPTQAEVIRLRYLEGYEFAEVAERMGLSVGAVKAQAQRAYQRMHADLGREFGYGEERQVHQKSPTAEVTALLQERGPLTALAIARVMRVKKDYAYSVLYNHPELFVVVGHTQTRGMTTYIWGLAGVHDEVAA